MTATCIVLNGTSCSGKSSIAAVLQELWPRPLQVTGIDTFLASQSARFFASDGRVVAGFSWIPVTIDRRPAFDVEPGPLGLGMIKASHAYWGACAAAGLDQVIDDVWLVPDQPAGLQDALGAAACGSSGAQVDIHPGKGAMVSEVRAETGGPNRTPRSEIRPAVSSNRKKEPVLLLDLSTSMNWGAADEYGPEWPDPGSRRAIVIEALHGLVRVLEREDSEAAAEQASSSDERGA
jgi:Chloramphenicol phosphotransferase-like protein